MYTPNIGDNVRMVLPDNLRVHNHIARVESVTDWGAHVTWNGGSGRFRLFFSEMQPVTSTGNVCTKCGSINVVRAGTCLLCRDCGDTSGGCS